MLPLQAKKKGVVEGQRKRGALWKGGEYRKKGYDEKKSYVVKFVGFSGKPVLHRHRKEDIPLVQECWCSVREVCNRKEIHYG